MRGSRQHCKGKTPMQCLLNTMWSLSSNFYFGPVNFSIISGCFKCHANIVVFSKLKLLNLQKKISWANIEQKDKLVWNNDIVHACWIWLTFLFYHDCSYFSCFLVYHLSIIFAISHSVHVLLSQYWQGISLQWFLFKILDIWKNLFFN